MKLAGVRGFRLEKTKTNSVITATSAAKDYLLAVGKVLDRLDYQVIDRMIDVIWRGYESGRTLFVFGNGGSAALASHFACDLGKGTIAKGRKRLKTVALTDNVALITAWRSSLMGRYGPGDTTNTGNLEMVAQGSSGLLGKSVESVE